MVADQVPDDPPRQELDALWRATQDRLRASVPESTYRLWLQPLEPAGSDGDTLYLTAPEGIRAWAERRYSSLIAEALADSGSHLRLVSFTAEREAGGGGGVHAGVELNPNYTFDRFVIGPGNRLAHAAALAVAEAPSEAYNPLFLHGPPGLGKTHLLAAIANYLRTNAPGLSVRYSTAESFTNEFVNALRSAGAEAFKARYRDIDVLLIDDVQFLEGKPHTEEEFFHTFNALYESGSQLVLSADRIPSELSTLASRLRDRFEWGLTVAVEPPNLATRVTVLRRLVREAGVDIADAGALSELANRIDANVRQLHGALTRVIAHASLMARPLSSELIAEVIPISRGARATPVEEIQQRVAERFGVSRAELVGSSRAATPLRARQVAIFLTREMTDLSLPQIGRLYGGRDHSTVLNSLRRVEAGLGDDADLAKRVEELRGAIHTNSGGGG
ncbi:MAG: chromosomal replication initiator protein [Solirubrobacterales bacterium]|jgi:chromosomal replication initiator protein|nr:chromosomal replication initiator protein [Solirubrobacterales bacterium]